MKLWDILQIIAEYAGLIILGAFSGMYLFSKALKQKRKEADESDSRLVGLLKDTVDELERKVDNLTKQQQENMDQIKRLSSDNEVITKIFQGRDSKSEEMYSMVKATMENTTRLFELMSKHMTLTEEIVGKMPQP